MNITTEIINILKPIFLNNITEDIDLISNEFSNYITQKYKYFNDKNVENTKRKNLINVIIDKEINIWGNSDVIIKKQLVMHDENLQKIFYISSKSFAYARRKLTENMLLSETEANSIKLELNKYFNLVLDHNKEIAERQLSEINLDLDYATGKIENITSIRLSGEIKLKK